MLFPIEVRGNFDVGCSEAVAASRIEDFLRQEGSSYLDRTGTTIEFRGLSGWLSIAPGAVFRLLGTLSRGTIRLESSDGEAHGSFLIRFRPLLWIPLLAMAAFPVLLQALAEQPDAAMNAFALAVPLVVYFGIVFTTHVRLKHALASICRTV